MNIDDKLLAHLENLANIKLTEEEKAIIKKDLNDILNYVEMLKEVDVENVEPLYSPISEYLKNVFHKDEVKNFENAQKIRDNFPDKKDNLLKVPGIQK